MVTFKSFIQALHDAVVAASDALMTRNEAILDRYFTATKTPDAAGGQETGTLTPKSIRLDYPHHDADGNIASAEIAVPMITLVSPDLPKLEKAVLKASFQMAMVDGEVCIDLGQRDGGILHRKPKTTWGSVELTFTPQDTPEGLRLVIEGYDAALKRQLS